MARTKFSPPSRLPSTRIEALDAIRQIAALVVFVHHFLVIFEINTPKWLQIGLLDAKGAVTLFFVLSGYVLALRLSQSSPSLKNYVKFVTRRALRLYPLHLAATTLTFAVLVWIKANGGFSQTHESHPQFLESSTLELRQWLLQTTLILPEMRSNFANPPVWTLMTEAKVAIVFPMLAWAILRIPLVSSCILVGCLVIGSEWAEQHLVGTAALLGLFAMGVLLARTPQRLLAKLESWHWFAWISLSIALYSAISFRYQMTSPWISSYLCGFGASGFILAILSWKALNVRLTKLQRIFRVDLSYGIYILHYPVMLWLRKATNETATTWNVPVNFLISFSITIVLSIILLYLIERPAIQFGRYLTSKRESESSASAAT